jgi:hypothetical protein
VNRQEAIDVLNQVAGECILETGQYRALTTDHKLSLGYQIHIKAPINDTMQACIKRVAEKYGLTVKMRNHSFSVIYRPKIKEG